MHLSTMIREIKANIGNGISQETDKLLNEFSYNFETLDNNLYSLK